MNIAGLMVHATPKFDPERYNAELQQFITQEAALSPQEAAKFFPLYREMQTKQRALFQQMHRYKRIKPNDEKSCREYIKKCDELDLHIKELQQLYHNKFLKILSASKVYDVLKAEDKFHRQMFSRGQQGRKGSVRPTPVRTRR